MERRRGARKMNLWFGQEKRRRPWKSSAGRVFPVGGRGARRWVRTVLVVSEGVGILGVATLVVWVWVSLVLWLFGPV